jgi:hypothetical protein
LIHFFNRREAGCGGATGKGGAKMMWRAWRAVAVVAVSIALLVFSVAQAADPVEAWVQRYNGDAHFWDYAYGLAVDAENNVIVAGETMVGFMAGLNALTVKYDPLGEEQWLNLYAGTEEMASAYAVTLDDEGNVYITGDVLNVDWDTDVLTVKYLPDGTQDWLATWDGAGTGDDKGRAIAVHEDGSVAVTGVSYADISSTASGDIVTIKYDSAGVEQWAEVEAGSGADEDYGVAVAFDSAGNVWSAGLVHDVTYDDDGIVLKYDPDGNWLGTMTYDSGLGNVDEFVDLQIWEEPTKGTIWAYVTGESCVAEDGDGNCYDWDIVTLRFNFVDGFDWTAEYSGTDVGYDWPTALAVLDDGSVAVTGSVINADTFYDMVTIEYTAAGDLAWDAAVDGPGVIDDGGTDVVVSDTGEVYATGMVTDEEGSNYDMVTVKYDPVGAEQWAAYYDGPAGGMDYGVALGLGDGGLVFVTGASAGIGLNVTDIVTIAYAECDGCYIAGVCYEDGDPNPENSCEYCDVALVRNEWTPDAGASCDDGLFCNGADTCDAEGECTAHVGDPCPDDGVFCNGDESCDEDLDLCESSGDPCPDNGLFCDGEETCDEDNDECDQLNVPCPDDALFCNGDEVCNEANDSCVHTGTPCADDGLFCTGTESCNEGNDTCVHSGNPCPDDGVFCNGGEACDEAGDVCQHAGDPCTDDGLFCTGTEFCNETDDLCGHTGDPCDPVTEDCNEDTNDCDPADDDDDDDNDDNDDNDTSPTDDDTADDDDDDDDTSPADDDNDTGPPIDDDDDDASPTRPPEDDSAGGCGC